MDHINDLTVDSACHWLLKRKPMAVADAIRQYCTSLHPLTQATFDSAVDAALKSPPKDDDGLPAWPCLAPSSPSLVSAGVVAVTAVTLSQTPLLVLAIGKV